MEIREYYLNLAKSKVLLQVKTKIAN